MMAQYQSFPGAAGDSRTLDKLKALRLPDLAGRSFLDVGCNEGFFCGFAHFAGATRAVGIDRSSLFIERARRRFSGCEFLNQGWDTLPDGSFDVVLLASALHYADDQPALIRRLVDCLSPGGVLILELGIVPSPEDEWVTVERGIDERAFPTMAKLRSVLREYAWKWMGPSVTQPGDPVPRHVVHVSRKRPMAYLLMAPPGYGKSSIATALFMPAGIHVISGDTRLDDAARGKVEVPDALSRHLVDYSPFALDRVIENVFQAGLGRELVELWMCGLERGVDFALEVYVPSDRQREVLDALSATGYFPVRLEWERVGPAVLPADQLAEQSERFYLSLAEIDITAAQGASPPSAAFKPIGFIDEIYMIAGGLVVRGWAIDAKGMIPERLSVRTAHQTIEVHKVEKQLRPDVQTHLSLPHALVGFRFSVPLSGESMQGLSEKFGCIASSGSGSFPLTISSSARSGLARITENGDH